VLLDKLPIIPEKNMVGAEIFTKWPKLNFV